MVLSLNPVPPPKKKSFGSHTPNGYGYPQIRISE